MYWLFCTIRGFTKHCCGGTGKALDAAQWIGQRARIPIAIGNGLAIGKSYWGEWGGQQIGIDGYRKSLRMSVDAAQRNREASGDLALDAEGSLLRDRGAIARLVHEENLQGREWAGIGNIDANWLTACEWASYGGWRDAGIIPRGRGGALNQSLRKECLENRRRAGYSQGRNPGDADRHKWKFPGCTGSCRYRG